MALDSDAINTEVRTVAGKLDVSWRDFATYVKGKIIEAGINGGVSSYTINGRTVTKDLLFWERALRLAMEMASIENSGGIDEMPIRFIARM
jgi:hypothetical protein